MIKKLRYGIMIDNWSLQDWQRLCIARLSPWADLSLIIKNDSKHSKWQNVGLRGLLFAVYWKLFTRAKSVMRKKFEPDIVTIWARPVKKGKYSEYFEPHVVKAVKMYDLDFILRFGFGIIRGDILDSARYGVWSFHHDDETKYRGGPPCFWEIYKGDNVTGAILQRLTDRLDGGIVLHRGYLKTKNWSYGRNVDQMYLESSRWPVIVCKKILNGVYSEKKSDTKALIYRVPNNWQMVKFIGKLWRNRVKEICRLAFRQEKWGIEIDGKKYTPPERYKFWADPFMAEKNGEKYILAENFDYRQMRGKISAFKYNGDLKELGTAEGFPTDVHLSYPYIFRDKGKIYCMPESHEAGNLCLYESVELPLKWRRVATLLDIPVVDGSLWKRDGLYWIFGCLRHDGKRHNLHAWYSKNLTGPYCPHEMNPIKTDVRSARPGGRIIGLIRPAQDNSGGYGDAVSVNFINKISPSEFDEEITMRHKGTHHVAGYGLADYKQYRFIPEIYRGLLRRMVA
jgi:hypothetical protein